MYSNAATSLKYALLVWDQGRIQPVSLGGGEGGDFSNI